MRTLLASFVVVVASVAHSAEIQLPPGFKATVFHPGVGLARHIAVRDNGDVYVALRYRLPRPDRDFPGAAGGIAALRDTDGDGVADVTEKFGRSDVGTGMAIYKDYLYFSSDQAVYRIRLDNNLVPSDTPVLIAGGFPAQRAHAAKPITFDEEGHLFVNSGAPSNACQQQIRTPGSPGRNPCPELERSAGIWRFDAATPWQDQLRDGERYVTGTRQIVALEWNTAVNRLFFTMHGRDQLDVLFSDYFSPEERSELPAEEFHGAEAGANIGWPYTYYDPKRKKRMKAPEYGGDGKAKADGPYQDPLIGFPAHWGPNDLIFYSGRNFPARYRGGAFIAFHGSWNRLSLQRGYNVVFVPFKGGRPSGDWEVFADGFAGPEPLRDSRDAQHRPTGLAQGPDGAIYITDSVKGTIWKVTYTGG